MISISRYLLIACLLVFPGAAFAQGDSGHGGHSSSHGQGHGAHDRGKYLYIKTIDQAKLLRQLDKVVLVDVRSPFEYQVIHINGSVNIPSSDFNFADKVKALIEKTGKKVVMYSNDNSCHVAFVAADKAIARHKLGQQVMVYDGGVSEWARLAPQLATLLDNTPLDRSRLIDSKGYQARLLEPMDFEKRLSKDVVVLDVRTYEQRDATGLFPAYDKWVRLDDIKRLKKHLYKVSHTGKPVYVYDEMGSQVKWLQYLLEESGIREYYFMNRGAEGYFAMLGDMHLKQKTFLTGNKSGHHQGH